MPGSPFIGQTTFIDQVFTDLELPASDLADKEFERCVFRHCKLPSTRFVRARLEDCRFESCDLSGMSAAHASLSGVRYVGTRLLGVVWNDLGLVPDVGFDNCDLRYTAFNRVKLARTKFVNSTLREASFEQTDLVNADFSGSDLTGTTFARCDLMKADFRFALGLSLDPTVNRVKGTRVSVDAAVAYLQTFGLDVG